jgi:hypothetical protein
MPTGNFELVDKMIHYRNYFAVLANPYNSNIQVDAKIVVYDKTKSQISEFVQDFNVTYALGYAVEWINS